MLHPTVETHLSPLPKEMLSGFLLFKWGLLYEESQPHWTAVYTKVKLLHCHTSMYTVRLPPPKSLPSPASISWKTYTGLENDHRDSFCDDKTSPWSLLSITPALFVPSDTTANHKGKYYCTINREDFNFYFFQYFIQHCFAPPDSTVSEDAGIEPRTVATSALAVRRSNRSARSHPVDENRYYYYYLPRVSPAILKLKGTLVGRKSV
jgi:hypothetical protein